MNITETQVDRIRTLAAELDTLGKTALEKVIEAGSLLIECKAELKHGEWLPWLKKNFTFSERTAHYWISIAKAEKRGDLKSATVADLGIREAIKIARPEKDLTGAQVDSLIIGEIDKRIDALLAPPPLEIEIPGRGHYKIPGDLVGLRRMRQTLESNVGWKNPTKKGLDGPFSMETRHRSQETEIYLGLNDPKQRSANVAKYGVLVVTDMEERFLAEHISGKSGNPLRHEDIGLKPPTEPNRTKQIRDLFRDLSGEDKSSFLGWALARSGFVAPEWLQELYDKACESQRQANIVSIPIETAA